jgi:hypothetical protein
MRSNVVQGAEIEIVRQVQDSFPATSANDVGQRSVNGVRRSRGAQDCRGLADQVLVKVDGRMLPHALRICSKVANVYADASSVDLPRATAVALPLGRRWRMMTQSPILLGDGTRLFEDLDPEEIELQKTSTIETPRATHLRFEVVK